MIHAKRGRATKIVEDQRRLRLQRTQLVCLALVAEVAAAAPPFTCVQGPGVPEDIDRRIWHWLQRQGPGTTPLHLGYGREDRFAPAHALMARSLPPERVTVLPGGHDWPVWTALWQHHLDHFHEHA